MFQPRMPQLSLLHVNVFDNVILITIQPQWDELPCMRQHMYTSLLVLNNSSQLCNDKQI